MNKQTVIAPLGSFSWALEKLKEGEKMFRPKWENKPTTLKSGYASEGVYIRLLSKDDTGNSWRKEIAPCFAIENMQDSYEVGFLHWDIFDILADDWEVFEQK
ncbi:Thoeris anti-defense Tad2 family protein [Bacillus cereus]|uniref:Thoeris anti-defense Tad2 family protein n=1 Tax=Bacillus cereus TaxID=1396 RepID=UPI001C8B82C5|nr:MW1434 family type I TA system toxin [Bacillus cereus]MBX9160030.1 DUF2829 domain-containing protein [Bacillus cereus]